MKLLLRRWTPKGSAPFRFGSNCLISTIGSYGYIRSKIPSRTKIPTTIMTNATCFLLFIKYNPLSIGRILHKSSLVSFLAKANLLRFLNNPPFFSFSSCCSNSLYYNLENLFFIDFFIEWLLCFFGGRTWSYYNLSSSSLIFSFFGVTISVRSTIKIMRQAARLEALKASWGGESKH